MPLLLAVSKSYNGSTQSATYRLFASVGGTTVASTSLTVSGSGVQPTHLKFGNASAQNPEGMYWYGGRIDEGVTVSDSAIEASLRDLSFLPVEN